jgi:hypothetical protein
MGNAQDLTNELDYDLSRAAANIRPFLGQITSFDAVFNAHEPGEAGRTTLRLLEAGPPNVVFIENCMLEDGCGVAEILDYSLNIVTNQEPQQTFHSSAQSYSGLITTALASKNSLVFPVDARRHLFKEIEAIASEEIGEDFLSFGRRFTPSALDNRGVDALVALEVDRLLKHAFMIEVRDKTAILQMLSFVTGLLNHDDGLLLLSGVKDEQVGALVKYIGDQAGKISLGSVYGFNHIGIPSLVRKYFPNPRIHQLTHKPIMLNRRRYGRIYVDEPDAINDQDRLNEIAARSVVEDIFFMAAHYPELFGSIVCVSDSTRKIAKIAKNTCDYADGALNLIDNLDPEQASRLLEKEGILFKL